MAKRRKFTPKFKAEVVLRELKHQFGFRNCIQLNALDMLSRLKGIET